MDRNKAVAGLLVDVHVNTGDMLEAFLVKRAASTVPWFYFGIVADSATRELVLKTPKPTCPLQVSRVSSEGKFLMDGGWLSSLTRSGTAPDLLRPTLIRPKIPTESPKEEPVEFLC